MDSKRRTILKLGLLSGGAAVSGFTPNLGISDIKAQSSGISLRILILGGTGFIGPHMVHEALRRGHEVTLFNRGRTNKDLFPNLETLIGDRNNDLDSLKGRQWDVVIDNSGYIPRHVADSARLLSSAASHYVYISTISTYASLAEPTNEDSPLAQISDETIEDITSETYGPLKVLCEKKAAEEFGKERLTILRPAYICGPGDHTDRYSYWPVRTMRGGKMVWPGNPKDKIQIIDVRDLANFTNDILNKKIIGIYNTVTPAGLFTMGDLLKDCLDATNSNMQPIWMNYSYIKSQIEGENVFPIWAPPLPKYAGDAMVSGERAVDKGLINRPTKFTARDTIEWWKTLPPERTKSLRAGPSIELEKSLLDNWHT